MVKKQLSFAEKAARSKAGHDWKIVKFIKSVKSEKTRSWRFNENMIRIEGNENLDAALKRLQTEEERLHTEMLRLTTKDVVEAPHESEAEVPEKADATNESEEKEKLVATPAKDDVEEKTETKSETVELPAEKSDADAVAVDDKTIEAAAAPSPETDISPASTDADEEKKGKDEEKTVDVKSEQKTDAVQEKFAQDEKKSESSPDANDPPQKPTTAEKKATEPEEKANSD